MLSRSRASDRQAQGPRLNRRRRHAGTTDKGVEVLLDLRSRVFAAATPEVGEVVNERGDVGGLGSPTADRHERVVGLGEHPLGWQ